MKIRFGYSDSDDRMWIRAGGAGPLWWVTRRLALRLVLQWATLMERTLPPVHGHVPDLGGGEDDITGAAAGRDAAGENDAGAESLDAAERLLHEHLAALASPRKAPSAAEPDGARQGEDEPPPASGVSALLYSVDLSARGGRIRLVLRSAGHHQVIAVPRDDGHRLLAAFVSRCRRNGWLEARLPAWLVPPPERA